MSSLSSPRSSPRASKKKDDSGWTIAKEKLLIDALGSNLKKWQANQSLFCKDVAQLFPGQKASSVRSKINRMMAEYKAARSQASRSGRGAVTFIHYDRMLEVFGASADKMPEELHRSQQPLPGPLPGPFMASTSCGTTTSQFGTPSARPTDVIRSSKSAKPRRAPTSTGPDEFIAALNRSRSQSNPSAEIQALTGALQALGEPSNEWEREQVTKLRKRIFLMVNKQSDPEGDDRGKEKRSSPPESDFSEPPSDNLYL